MRIAIVGPLFFASRLAEELRKRGNSVSVIFHEEIWELSVVASAKRLQRAEAIYFLYGSALRSAPLAFILRILLSRKLLVHFIGSDVRIFLCQTGWPRLSWTLALRMAHRVIAVSPKLVERLSPHVNVDLLPLVFRSLDCGFAPYPEQFTVLVYLPPSRAAFYGRDLVARLVDDIPDARFIILGKHHELVRPHVEQSDLDYSRDMDKVYRRTSVLLRLTEHDGLSNMVIESLARGRHVVWTQRFPFCMEVSRDYDSVRLALEKVKAAAPNRAAMQWVRTTFKYERIIDDIERLLRDPKLELLADRGALYD